MKPSEIVLTIEDADGETAEASIHYNPESIASFAELELTASQLWARSTPLMTGRLVGASVVQRMNIDSWAAPSNSSSFILSDVQEKVEFIIQSRAANGKLQENIFTLPTVLESIFLNLGASSRVDMTHPAVVSLVNLLTIGYGAGPFATSYHGRPILAVTSGQAMFRGRKS